jgi:hypothetical protein
MRSATSFQPATPEQAKIRHLEFELDKVRRAMIRMVPPRAQAILGSYSSCESRAGTSHWKDNIAEKILELAEILPDQDDRRAYCPLCGEGTSSPYEEGFSVPEGLRRHLIGWGRGQKCDVVEASEMLAREYWHFEFHEAEEAERAQIATSPAQTYGIRTDGRRQHYPIYMAHRLRTR